MFECSSVQVRIGQKSVLVVKANAVVGISKNRNVVVGIGKRPLRVMDFQLMLSE